MFERVWLASHVRVWLLWTSPLWLLKSWCKICSIKMWIVTGNEKEIFVTCVCVIGIEFGAVTSWLSARFSENVAEIYQHKRECFLAVFCY